MLISECPSLVGHRVVACHELGLGERENYVNGIPNKKPVFDLGLLDVG